MQESNESKPEANASAEPLTEPSQPSEIPFIPKMGVRELRATWEMLANFKEAILSVEWPGAYVQAVAMGLEMIKRMEINSRGQFELAKKNEKADNGSANG